MKANRQQARQAKRAPHRAWGACKAQTPQSANARRKGRGDVAIYIRSTAFQGQALTRHALLRLCINVSHTKMTSKMMFMFLWGQHKSSRMAAGAAVKLTATAGSPGASSAGVGAVGAPAAWAVGGPR